MKRSIRSCISILLLVFLCAASTESQPFNWSTTPLTWVGYRYANGNAIQDPANDVSNRAAYNLTFDLTNAPFTLQMAATGTHGAFRIQVEGLTQWSTNSYIVFVANASNTILGRVFLSLSGNSGDIGFYNNSSTLLVVDKGPHSTNMAGWARIVAVPNTSNSYIDFQFPLSSFYTHLGITSTTPLKFYVGTSTGAGNLANINIDWMTISSNGIPSTSDFSTLAQTSVTSISNGALPVELTTFTARHYDGRTELRWETATELNNYGFEVQRATAGGEWNAIGFVPGAGTVHTPRRYEYVDRIGSSVPPLRYRLRQIDRDGREELSWAVEVHGAAIPEASISCYPHPVRGETTVSCSLPRPGAARVSLVNALGREVRVLREVSIVNAELFSFALESQGLPRGQYYIIMTHAQGRTVHPLILVD